MTPLLALTVDPWILAFSAVTVIVTIWMGFRSAKTSKTASDFFVAGRSVSVGWNASAISGEYLSAASFMGVAGMVMSSGYDALWYPVCYACGYLFLLLFIAGPLRRFGAYTIPDFAEGRFDSPLFRKIAVVFVLFIGFFYTMPQMKGAGTTLAYIFPGLPYWAGVVLVGAVITLNVALGGMKGITLVQAFQYWAKMFAISVPIFVLMAVYGHYGRQLSVNSPSVADSATTAYLRFSTGSRPASIIKEAELAVDAAKSGKVFFWQTVPTAWSNVFKSYANFLGADVMVSPRLLGGDAPAFAISNHFRPFLIKEFERIAATNGIEILESVGGVKWAATSGEIPSLRTALTQIEVVRKELPAKAPPDSTWLNPFGPLTTKAAKAFAARANSDYELLVSDELLSSQIRPLHNVIYGQNLPGLIEQIKAKLQKPPPSNWRTMIPAGATNVMGFMPGPLLVFEAASGKNVLWQTNLANLPKFSLNVTHSDKTTDPEFAAILEATLRSNGVALVQASDSTVVAVGVPDLQRQRSSAQVTSEKKTRPYALLYTYSLIIAIVCGTAGLPHILVRFYTNPDGVAAKRTTMWVMILIGVFYVFPPVFGVMGRNLLPELYSGVGSKGTDKIVLELPRIISERYGVLGSILSGITCAGAFAAFMSTFSGLLVSMTGALAHDVYGRMLNPKASAEQRMKMFKWCAVLIGGVAMLLGSFVEPLEINFMVGQAFAIAAASYFPLLFMAVWWRKLTMKGAATGMLTGGLSALIGISLTSFSTLAVAPGKTGELFALFKPLNDFWAAHPLLRILCEQPAIWAVPLAIVLMVIVSKLTSKDVPEDIRMKMLVLHAPEKLGLKQEYIQEHQPGH